jgi:UDP-N-acetylmuramate--alanine ligase
MTHYHLIGIGGTGLAPIARVLLERGYKVSGSDLLLSPQARELQELGIPLFIGHHADNIKGADIVIRSSAIPDGNLEVIAALHAGIPVLKRADFLNHLVGDRKLIAIAGTHGKTTTTAMMAWVLSELEQNPSFIIGGVSKNLKTNAHADIGSWFVIEADEYDGMFLGLQPDILIITSIEHDHPDYYPTPQKYFSAFVELLHHIKSDGDLILCTDHIKTIKLLDYVNNQIKIHTYGINKNAEFYANDIQHIPGCGVHFTANDSNLGLREIFQLQIPGEHNVRNAMAVICAASLLGYSMADCRPALESFIGTGRRFDIKGEAQGITIIDDYAHHPTEIRSTISAARCNFPNANIWVVWQPHTYSRTLTLFDDFLKAFNECDHLIVTEIYKSREKERPYSSAQLVEQIHHADVHFIADIPTVTQYLIQHLKSGDVLLVLSAGDADQISSQVLTSLKAHVEQDSKNE